MATEIMSLDDIKKGLEDRRLLKVSEITGLSYPTLKKLANGDDVNYTLATVIAVSEYLSNDKGQ